MAYIVCHPPHHLARDLVEDGLEICLARAFTYCLEVANALGQVLRQSRVGENLQVLRVQETQAGFTLDSPQLAIRVDDTMA